MEYARLGSSGLKVSRICLGMMSYGDRRPASLAPATRTRPSRSCGAPSTAGVTFFDTADMYSDGASEEITGRLLRQALRPPRRLRARHQGLLPDGPGPNDRGLSRKHILAAIDASLRRLGTDYVDLYQIHRWDHETPDRGDHGGAARRGQGGQGPLHRRVQHVRLAVRQGPARRRAARLDAGSSPCRTTTTWSTGRRSGRCSRSALDQGVGVHPVQPAGPRPAGRQPRPAAASGSTVRAGHDPLADELYDADADFDVVDAAARRSPAERGAAARPGRPGLAARPARRDRARSSARPSRPPRRRAGGRGPAPDPARTAGGWRRRTGRTRSSATPEGCPVIPGGRATTATAPRCVVGITRIRPGMRATLRLAMHRI